LARQLSAICWISCSIEIPRDALFRYRFATPRRVINRWVTPDLSDCEILFFSAGKTMRPCAALATIAGLATCDSLDAAINATFVFAIEFK
jgi:hypothetical protein